MSNIKLTLVALALAIPLYANAEEKKPQRVDPPETITVPVPAFCVKSFDSLVVYLAANFGETPIGEGNTLMPLGQNLLAGDLIFFASNETYTYSMVIKFKDDSACLINNGNSFRPYGAPEPEIKDDIKLTL